uniref:EGF-like domain-containing protein n=1 Tax=Branchiostoma floridae TaxID=7739 RepID=C3ZIM6_BRAFL|eukprot:XP_002591550.1 hypothetical protein BRAFLDRAFT_105086 [Branchiostoma floridae]
MRDPYLSIWVLFTVTAVSLPSGSSSDNVTSGSDVDFPSATSSSRVSGQQYSHSPYSVHIQLKLAQRSPANLSDPSSPQFLNFLSNIRSETSKAYRGDHNFLRLDVFKSGTFTATTESNRDVRCVRVGHHCFPFCHANLHYCVNGGTCQEDGTVKLLCTCIYEPFVHYAGARCDTKINPVYEGSQGPVTNGLDPDTDSGAKRSKNSTYSTPTTV